MFEPDLNAMASDSLRMLYTTTQCTEGGVEASEYRTGRVSSELIGEAVEWLGSAPDVVYVCGPPGMAEGMVELCAAHGVAKEAVQFESWW